MKTSAEHPREKEESTRQDPAAEIPAEWPVVSIVTLTWNQCDLTLDCLASLASLDYPAGRLQILVADNGSSDGTVEAIHHRFPNVRILENGENLGYAGGNNAGISQALAQGAEYVCILNNDVTVAPGFLIRLLRTLEENQEVGVVTPLVAEAAKPEQVWAMGSVVNGRTGIVTRLHAGERVKDWQNSEPFDVDAASGTAMLVRSMVFERSGLLDESYYLYYEEVDWCCRVRQAGYRIMAVPTSVIWHKVSATLGPSSPVIDYYMLRNHLLLIGRHWSGLRRWRLLTKVVLRNLLHIAAYTAKPHGRQRLPHRNARLMALRDALLGRWGRMGPDVESACYPKGQ